MPFSRINSSSSSPAIVFAALFFSLTPARVSAQPDQSGTTPPFLSSPDTTPSTSGPDNLDRLPILPQPPPVKERPPIPVPPPVALPEPPESVTPKPTLSWRAKAYALANEPPFLASADKLAWSLPVSYDSAGQLLTSALAQMGFQLLASYPDAGHYLARLRTEDGDTQMIIVVQPVDNSLTSFQLKVLPEGHHRDKRRIEDLPKVMNTIMGNRGVL